jgi:hypothetical protein
MVYYKKEDDRQVLQRMKHLLAQQGKSRLAVHLPFDKF